MPVSRYFCLAAVAAAFLIRFFFRQTALGTAGPSLLLHSAASGARCFQLVLTERTFDEVIADRVATLRAKCVFAGGVSQSDANYLFDRRQVLSDQAHAVVFQRDHA